MIRSIARIANCDSLQMQVVFETPLAVPTKMDGNRLPSGLDRISNEGRKFVH